ncbi:hypothetical protein QSJ18_20070, partial [Gordonia sp. ABSL1-1]|uniref:hypothetical protein n=1 Tax=Gordonia sp. ABSL1-1 TaxID=3053923 RepID=UPI0025738201
VTAEEWERRAAVAEGAAEALEQASIELDAVQAANYFGKCLEGEAMFAKLGQAIGDWQAALTGQTDALNRLAAQCRRGQVDFDDADRAGESGFRT